MLFLDILNLVLDVFLGSRDLMFDVYGSIEGIPKGGFSEDFSGSI